MNNTLDIYHQGAALFAEQYDALRFEQVHQSWQPFWPDTGMMLDIGAGSGRDALWLAEHGCQVIAVEPAENLRQIGQCKTGRQVQIVMHRGLHRTHATTQKRWVTDLAGFMKLVQARQYAPK